MAMCDLPPELWCRIAQYLPQSTLKELYGVNRVFFDLAMSERYREVSFDKLDDHTVNLLNRLRYVFVHVFANWRVNEKRSDPDTARRVQMLHISPHFMHNLTVDEASASENGVFQWFKLSVFGRRMTLGWYANCKASDTIDAPSSQITEKLVDVTYLMPNVRYFNLHWDSFFDYSAPYLDSSWLSFAHNLQELTLSITTVKLHTLFPLPASFPLLEKLHVTIHARDYPEHRQELINGLSSLAKFINSLSSTLEHLQIRCHPVQDLSFLYERITHLKVLSSIDLDMSLMAAAGAIIPIHSVSFLQRQSHTLRDLCLSTSLRSNPWGTYQFSLDALHLSRLSSLSISAGLLAFDWDHSLAFMAQHISSLQSLTVNGPLAPSELSKLLESLHHRDTSAALSYLSFSVYQLDSRLIHKLATTLRRLKSLNIQTQKIACDSMHSITPSPMFPRDSVRSPCLSLRREKSLTYLSYQISGKIYPFVRELPLHPCLKLWELQDMTIKRRSCCGDLVLWGLMAFCAQHIPSMKSFERSGNMVLPDPLQSQQKRCSEILCAYGSDHSRW